VFKKSIVIDIAFKGWILEAMAKEAAEAIGQKANMYFIPTRKKDFINVKSLIPSLRFYLERRFFKRVLFINQNTYFYAILKNAIDTPLQYCEVLYTHYVETDLSRSQQAELLSKLCKVFVYNSTIKEELVQYGVPREIIQVIYGAINRKIYYPQVQYDKSKFACLTPYILVVGRCKSRKNPDLIAKVISEMKSHQFVIHGTGFFYFFS
jgi:glycosyltransferase involved in cell wall biosynthesis